MTSTRVGVLSHDNSLIVDLSLRATGMSITGIDDVDDLRDYDVALVDMPKDVDAVDVLMRVPPGPACVVLSHGPLTVVPEVGPVTVVARPCSLTEVLEALRTARQAPIPVGVGASASSTSPLWREKGAEEDAELDDGLVVVLDDSGPATVTPRTPPRLFTKEGFGPSVQEREVASGPDSGADQEDSRPFGDYSDGPTLDAGILMAVADDVATWAVEHELRLDARSLGDRLARLVTVILEADNTVIWKSEVESFAVLGAFGITDAAKQARIPADHPVLRLAHTHSGVFLRTPGHAGARAPGFPGAGSSSYVVIVLPDGSGPAALLTVGAPELPSEFVDELRSLMLDVASLWPTD